MSYNPKRNSRNEISKQIYGKPFSKLTKSQKMDVEPVWIEDIGKRMERNRTRNRIGEQFL